MRHNLILIVNSFNIVFIFICYMFIYFIRSGITVN